MGKDEITTLEHELEECLPFIEHNPMNDTNSSIKSNKNRSKVTPESIKLDNDDDVDIFDDGKQDLHNDNNHGDAVIIGKS